jgi:multiple sugar transport system substrate-binding protein
MRFGSLIVVMMLCLGIACSDDEAGADQQESTGPLRVQVSGEPEETAVYAAVTEAFEKDTGIDVQLIEVAEKDDHLAKLSTAFSGGTPPDVFLVNFREYSQFVTRGAVEAVGPYLEESDVDLDAYYPQPIEAFTFDDELQCMPQNISSLVVYYNRALFKEAGLGHPEDDWSWEDFRQTALALTRNDQHGLGIEPQVIRLAPFAWSNGGEIVDDLEQPTRLTLDDPATREALEFLVSLVREDDVVPNEEELTAQDLETRFVTGKLGMLLSSRKDTPVFREVQGLDWDVAALPVAGERAGILHSDGYCIAAQSDKVEDAAAYIEYATGEQGQTISALGGRTVPALKSVANSGSFLDPTQAPRHSRVFLDGIPFIQRTPVIPTWPEIEDVSEEFLTRAFYEPGYTIDQAIADIEAQTGPLFEEAAE